MYLGACPERSRRVLCGEKVFLYFSPAPIALTPPESTSLQHAAIGTHPQKAIRVEAFRYAGIAAIFLDMNATPAGIGRSQLEAAQQRFPGFRRRSRPAPALVFAVERLAKPRSTVPATRSIRFPCAMNGWQSGPNPAESSAD